MAISRSKKSSFKRPGRRCHEPSAAEALSAEHQRCVSQPGTQVSNGPGALLSLVTLGFFATVFAQSIFVIVTRGRVPFVSSDRSGILFNLLPLGMLSLFLLGVTPAMRDRAIQFSASEIDFLFPAPFTRRQLLAFFLLRGLVPKLGLAVIVTISFSVLVPSILSAILGIFLSLVFLHGATVASQLVQQTISTQVYSRFNRIVVVLVVVAIGIGVARAMPTGADNWTRLAEFRRSTPVQWITAPFDIFSRIIVAPQLFPEAIPDLSIALVINAAVYWLVFRLDARYEDQAVRTSQRMYERLQAARSGNMYAVTVRTEYGRSLMPRFPWWLGVGPNLRRQLLSGLRDMRHMFWFALIVAVIIAAVVVFVLRENPKLTDYVGYMVLGATAYVTFILSGQLPFGFRGDLNHMEVLKSLPLPPIAIASAEVIGASIIGCLGQWFFIVVGILGAPSQSAILLSGAAFFFPFNLLLFGVNNLLLLLFPFRLVGGGPDVTLMGRVMIMMMGNLFAVLFGFAIAAIPAAIVFLITSNWATTLVVAWIGLMLMGFGLLFVVAWAFRRFDISTDMPD